VAFTAHFEWRGKSKHLLLDIVKLPKSHMGANLVEVFHNVLKEFKLEAKASTTNIT